jgi:hypothetical protein
MWNTIKLDNFCSYMAKFRVWYFVSKNFLTYFDKKLFKWSRKTFEIWGWKQRIFKTFENTKTIYSNSEMSDQQNAFLTCSWKFLLSNKLEQLEFKLEENNWDSRNMQEKLESILHIPTKSKLYFWCWRT